MTLTMPKLDIDQNRKVRVIFCVIDQSGAKLHEVKKNLSPSYLRRGIKKWFIEKGVDLEDVVISQTSPSHLVAVGFYGGRDEAHRQSQGME